MQNAGECPSVLLFLFSNTWRRLEEMVGFVICVCVGGGKGGVGGGVWWVDRGGGGGEVIKIKWREPPHHSPEDDTHSRPLSPLIRFSQSPPMLKKPAL